MICSVALCVNDTKVCHQGRVHIDQLLLGLFEESVHSHEEVWLQHVCGLLSVCRLPVVTEGKARIEAMKHLSPCL